MRVALTTLKASRSPEAECRQLLAHRMPKVKLPNGELLPG